MRSRIGVTHRIMRAVRASQSVRSCGCPQLGPGGDERRVASRDRVALHKAERVSGDSGEKERCSASCAGVERSASSLAANPKGAPAPRRRDVRASQAFTGGSCSARRVGAATAGCALTVVQDGEGSRVAWVMSLSDRAASSGPIGAPMLRRSLPPRTTVASGFSCATSFPIRTA